MKNIDPYFAKVYSEKLLQKLEKQFGPFTQRHVDLSISSAGMLDLMAKMNQKSRRGEVIMVIPNQEGHLWLHTKAFYPQGVYRLMTGGLELGEKPQLAFQREVKEETGFKTKIDRCLAVITYTITSSETSLPFVSYVFLTKHITGFPSPTDASELITNFKVASVSALTEVAQKLRSLEGDWADWGIFRAVAHDVVQEQLR